MTAPLIIGLTGGIASGKSTAVAAFRALGVPVLDADEIARQVVEPGEPLLEKVQEAFGPDVIGADGKLDRAALRRIVFADAARRAALERLLHPAIWARLLDQARAVQAPYVVLAVPLLLETGGQDRVDRVLVIDAAPALQLERLMRRDQETLEGAQAMLAAQADRADRLAIAHDVIENAGSLDSLRASVAALHRRYLALARARR